MTELPPSAQIAKTVLDNGVSVVTESMDHLRSVSVGVWLDCGSRNESSAEGGISHFIEHMVFKGSENRSAEEIACAIDGIGGQLDAFTTKETVAFTAKVLDDHLPMAVDVISDMALHPVFDEGDIEREKGVILEELKMDEDMPDTLIHDLFASSFWSGDPLGRPIIGSKERIEAFDRSQLRSFHRRWFRPDRLLVTAAGKLDHGAVVELVQKRFGSLGDRSETPAPDQPVATPAIELHDKPSLEQAHICIGSQTHAMDDPRRYVGYLLSTILGGGVSSRLFIKIREQAGLAYSVFADQNLYADCGCVMVYAGASAENVPEVTSLVLAEFRDLKNRPVDAAELRRAKDYLKGSLTLSLESASSRMSSLARQEKYFRRWISLEEIHGQIEKVGAEEVQALAGEWFRQESLAVTVLGDLNGLRLEREDLAC